MVSMTRYLSLAAANGGTTINTEGGSSRLFITAVLDF